MMIFDFPSLASYGVILILNLFLFFLLYIKYIKSIFDPIFYGFVIYFGFTSSMMFIVEAVSFSDIFEYFIFQIMFLLGFIVAQNFFSEQKVNYNTFLTRKSLNFLSWITTLSFIWVALVNIYFFSKHGVTILADDPTVQKVAVFSGEGWVRRINWGIGIVPIAGSLILISTNQNKKSFMAILILSMIFMMASGSKSALLPIVFFGYILASHKSIINYQNSKKIMRVLPGLFILAVFSALLVLVRGDNSIADGIYALINRLLYNGDVIIYYYEPDIQKYFSEYNFGTYLYNSFNGVLGMLRIVPYETPTGYQMVEIYNNYKLPFDTVLGPNTPFYIAADMYFGSFFGCFYALFVGAFIGISRALFLRSTTNAVYLMLFAILYLNSFSFMVEAALFVNKFFDFLFIFILIFSIVYFLYQVSKLNRKELKC